MQVEKSQPLQTMAPIDHIKDDVQEKTTDFSY